MAERKYELVAHMANGEEEPIIGDITVYDGVDGISPTVSLSKSGKVTTLEITDKNGTQKAEILDGSVEEGEEIDLTDYAKKSDIPTKISAFDNDKNYLTSYTETDPTVPDWAKADSKPTYTAAEVGALPANTKIPTALSDLESDPSHRLIMDAERAAWNNKADSWAIPTKTSELTNDSGYLTSAPVTSVNSKTGAVVLSASDVGADPTGTAGSAIDTHNTNTVAHNDIRVLIENLTTRFNTLANSDDTTLDQLSEIVSYIKNNKTLIEQVTTNKVNVTDIINNLTTNVSNKPLSAAQGVVLKSLIDAIKVPTKVSELDNDSGYLTEHQSLAEYAKTSDLGKLSSKDTVEKTDLSTAVQTSLGKADSALQSYTETDPTVPSWAKASTKPTYTPSEVGAVPTTRTVNGKALSSNITLGASDVGALPATTSIPSKLSDLTADSTHRVVTDTEKSTWNSKANTSDIPTKVSQLTNDKDYLTSYTETDPTVPSWAKASTKPSYTKSEVGLGNVDNVKQYSASNPPPYPVSSVNSKTGAVSLSASDVGADASGTADSAVSAHNTSASAHADIRTAINSKVDKDAITLGLHSDGKYYIFVNGAPVGTGLSFSNSDVFGYVDANNNIILNGNIADGTYTVKYEMDNGDIVNVGNLVLDSNVYYSVTKNLTYCTINNNAAQVIEGQSYSSTITANSGYVMKSIKVTMGGEDISSSAVSGNSISITNVTGNIIITAAAEEEANTGVNLADPTSSDWMEGYRLSTSKGTPDPLEGHTTTNFIPAKMGDVLRVKGLDITTMVNSKPATITCYDKNKTYQANINGYASTGMTVGSATTGAKDVVSVDGDIQTYTILLLGNNTQKANSETAYIRVDGTLNSGCTANDVIITINEPIL